MASLGHLYRMLDSTALSWSSKALLMFICYFREGYGKQLGIKEDAILPRISHDAQNGSLGTMGNGVQNAKYYWHYFLLVGWF